MLTESERYSIMLNALEDILAVSSKYHNILSNSAHAERIIRSVDNISSQALKKLERGQ